jgi:hypothetical protein
MRGPWLVVAVLSLGLGLASAEDEDGEDLPPRPEPLALSTDADTVRLVPLVPGQLPDLERGGVIRPSCGQGVDPAKPAHLRWLPCGDLLVRRGGTQADGYSRFARDPHGRMVEGAVGEWPRGWRDAGAADVNGDGIDDLLLTRKGGKGYTHFEYKIARGRPNGSFDFGAAPVRILQRKWAAVFDLADVTGDGQPDLVFHHQPHGAAHPVTLFAVAGRADGTFAPEAEQIVLAQGQAGAAMSGIVLEDFNRDGGVDLLLPPDDDVPDRGQAYILFQGREGLGKLQESVDFAPKDEGWTADRGSYLVQTCDVDLDGNRDLIAWYYSWTDERYSVTVHFGDGRGAFGNPQVLLAGKTKAKPTMAWRLEAIEW